MTEQITFNLAAAQEAQNRLDDGMFTDDDEKAQLSALAAPYEGYLQQEWDRVTAEWDRADRARWLTRQCGGCEPGGTGEACDEHWVERSAEADRRLADEDAGITDDWEEEG